MSGNKYLTILGSGIQTLVAGTQVSTGVPDAGKIVSLNASGVIDSSMISGGGGGDLLTKIQLISGGDGTGSSTTIGQYNTIQAALNAIPAGTNSTDVRKVYVVLIPPGTYDEDLTVNITNCRIQLYALGPVNIGLFNNTFWAASNARNITINCTAANINGIRASFGMATYDSASSAEMTHTAYTSSFRLSGSIIWGSVPTWDNMELALSAEIFGDIDTSISPTANAFHMYFNRARVRGQIKGPRNLINFADYSTFDGLITCAGYATIHSCNINAGMTVSMSSTTGLQPWGIIGSYITGTFTGPAGSMALDGTSNYFFTTTGGVLAGGATQVLVDNSGSGITQLTGDVTAGPGSGPQVATIGNSKVTNAKLATMATSKVKGNLSGSTTNPSDVDAVSTNTANSVVVRDSSGNFSAGMITANVTGNLTGNADTSTATTNATNIKANFYYTNADLFVGLFTGTGAYEPVQLGSNLTFNPSTSTLKALYIQCNDITATNSLTGHLIGTADKATQIPCNFYYTNADLYCGLFTANGTPEPCQAGGGLTFNPATATLKATNIIGALTGNASTATTATNATNVDTQVASWQTIYLVGGVNSTAGFQGLQVGPGLTFNQNTGTLTATTFSGNLTGNASGTAANVTDTVAIGNGGTGQITKAAGFNALSPMTTLGDMIYANATPSGVRLAGNTTTTKQFLSQTGTGSASAAPVWAALASADIPNNAANTTGSAAKWTTARTLAGNSVDGSANVTFSNKFIVQGTADAGLSGAQFLGALGTGLVKNTTSTGILSIATAADVTGQAMTGFVSGAGIVSASDTILSAIQKVDGNVNNIVAGGSAVLFSATDGNLTVTTNNLTSGPLTSGALTRDAYFNNLTISGSGAIKTAGFKIFVAGTLDITGASAGAITASGGNGGNGAASATGGTAGAVGGGTGTVGPGTIGIVGGAGGTAAGTAGGASTATSPGQGGACAASLVGGTGSGGAGGAAGASVAPTSGATFARYETNLLRGTALMQGGVGGRGGNGGGGDGTAGGGGGGGGGGAGIVYIACNNFTATGAATSAIQAMGGNGGNGGTPAAGTRGGGSGGPGGGGGWIVFYYNTVVSASSNPEFDASGGQGGAGGNGTNGTSSGGGGGGGGAGGRILIYNIKTGACAETFGGTPVAGNAQSGGTGGGVKAGQVIQYTL